VDDEANVQDGVCSTAVETELKGLAVEKKPLSAGGKRYAVYVRQRVSLAHQAQIHGPRPVV
jgi:carbonic anhydrase/acetyltransferase-like protein (isoleucine patch superfamily)